MIRLAGLGHCGLRVRDLGAAARFYGDILGLAPGGRDERHARLHLRVGGHCLDLVEEGGPPLHHVAFAVGPGQKIAAAAEELRAAGVAVADGGADPAGHGETIRFQDPDGQVVELYEPPPGGLGGFADRPLRPNRLQHLVIQTPEVERAAAFYTERLGFRISDWMGRKFVWLRCGTDHHDFAIVYAPAPGMDHYAYEIAGWEEVKTWCDFLCGRGIRLLWGPGRHGPGNNLFVIFVDPDGNRIELSCEMEQYHDAIATYHPRQWHDLNLTPNLWGPGPSWRA